MLTFLEVQMIFKYKNSWVDIKTPHWELWNRSKDKDTDSEGEED